MTISGVTEPIISQRVVEQVIQLKDGEPSILAGLMQAGHEDRDWNAGAGGVAVSEVLLRSRTRRSSDEIVFLLIPHIVRESMLTDQNTRAIYTGTSQSIELMRQAPADAADGERSEGAAADPPRRRRPRRPMRRRRCLARWRRTASR